MQKSVAENRREIGTKKETLAIDFLKTKGVQILDRNFYFSGGELDIVAKDGEYLCFIEVKYRKNDRFGCPEDSVTFAKQKKMIKGARQYLYSKKYPEQIPCRFDVIAIHQEDITWIQNAFSL